ncbi:MAG TPA: glutaminyl-peptide cyclotransferase [Streptosporangiaceae bacterium]
MRFHRLKMLRRLPHPGRGFTQGLILAGGAVWESTGLYGQSSLRRYRLGAGEWEACAPLPPALFAEGICRAGESIWQLTWQERTALRWHPDTLALLETVPYNREGWGICNTGDHILTSDGSGELVRRDPRTLAPLEVIRVRCEGGRVAGLNDLEWSGGRVWANIITQPYLAGIDPGSGEVTDIVDAHLGGEHHWGDPQAVLNGIAAMPGPGGAGTAGGGGAAGEFTEFLLTGKGWRFLHHVRLIAGRRRRQPARLLVPAD